jgi:DNA-binding response OmpR family regulator
MAVARRVLAIDQQQTTLQFLRSVLPMVEGERFEVTRAFSAEEGLLALRRQPYDLLITGLRLPGVDGMTLGHWAKRLRPEMSVIVATGLPLEKLRDHAAAAGIDHLLHKPLDAEEFLAAVKESLAATAPAASQVSGVYAAEQPLDLPNDVLRRLEALGEETGAIQVVLATVAGKVIHVTGNRLQRDLPRLIAATAASVRHALYLAGQVDEQEPRVVQFVEGARSDLYWANVGREYFVVSVFDTQSRRGRLGTVWVFTQRAVNDLRRLLAAAAPAAGAPDREEAAGPGEENTEERAPVTHVVPTRARAEQQPVEAAAAPAEQGAAEAMAPEPPEQANVETDRADEQSRTPEELALDAFWDDALATYNGPERFGAGISLKEAKARGLISEDFNPEQLGEQSEG